MKKVFNNSKDTSYPWVESPFFNLILKKKKISNYQKQLAKKFNRDGYIVIDLKLNSKFVKKLTNDIDKNLKAGKVKKNPSIYHYNESPRIVEAWKFSKNVGRLALNNKILKTLKFLYDRESIAFSTLNFMRGTEQPLHSDYMHFSSIPERFLAGAWVALEDVNKNNGALAVVPGSHKLPIVDFNTLNCKKPDSIQSLEKCYRVYEDYVRKIVKVSKLRIKPIYIKKGQAILWAANLLHGGTRHIKKKNTRRSQVIHYHFKNCSKYYNPGFSVPSEGDYAIRELEPVKI